MYGKSFAESKTLLSLLSSKLQYDNCNLLVWNNGPTSILFDSKFLQKFKNKGFSITFVETVDNEALAKVYNKSVGMVISEKYVFLDDDTVLNDTYLNEVLLLNGSSVSVPLVYHDSKNVGPVCNGVPVEKRGQYDSHSFIAIGSGMVLTHSLILEFQAEYSEVFDTRFYLYGVDTTFFLRLNKLSVRPKIKVISGFVHSLSRLENESDVTKIFRKKERAYDYALTIRYYYSTFKVVYLVFRLTLSTFFRFILNKERVDFLSFYKGLILGRHYRHSKDKRLKKRVI